MNFSEGLPLHAQTDTSGSSDVLDSQQLFVGAGRFCFSQQLFFGSVFTEQQQVCVVRANAEQQQPGC